MYNNPNSKISIMKKILLLSFLLIITLKTTAQDIAMLNIRNENVYKEVNQKITPIIEETQYTYRLNGNNVLVSFKGDEHIEYYENKKYYIKSKIQWISNDECYITIQESTLYDFPFKRGAKLYLKILKIKKGKVFYKSSIGGRSWEGKMKILQ